MKPMGGGGSIRVSIFWLDILFKTLFVSRENADYHEGCLQLCELKLYVYQAQACTHIYYLGKCNSSQCNCSMKLLSDEEESEFIEKERIFKSERCNAQDADRKFYSTNPFLTKEIESIAKSVSKTGKIARFLDKTFLICRLLYSRLLASYQLHGKYLNFSKRKIFRRI